MENNMSDIFKSGNLNQATTNQSGMSHMSTVAQMGNGNMAMVTNLTKDRFT
jgi:hypothetical protein